MVTVSVSLRTLARAIGAGCLLSALVHLLVPRLLLRTAEWGYRRVLAVDFEPRAGATRRVRVIGLGFGTVGVAVLWAVSRSRPDGRIK